ncbi:diguanylate cyclase [Isoptericola sp. b490]|uniref:sensor domain-containing diguanylate cyclase n=1 Tax=Actinotalea lenta TaxID=3064654 RepID=UPI0027132B09|nr:sensor domain-containing diguanylate cyclase [Isoptericola sp. b490]MDO8121728.1 diguanylate cyclase [Isoptericola sp. b490]
MTDEAGHGPGDGAGPWLPDGELARTLDLLSELVVRYRVDDLKLVYCNRAWAGQFREDPASLLGRPLDQLLNDAEMAGLRAQLSRLGPDAPFLHDERPRPASRDRERWVEWTDRYLPLPGGPEVLAVGRDVTERHNAQLALAASENLFRTLAESATDLVWRLGTDPPALTYLSPSIERIAGWPADRITGDVERLRGYLDDDGRQVLERALAGDQPPDRFDLRLQRADGAWVTLEMQVARLPDGWQGIGRDVTKIRELQTELEDLALRDPLTGLANRRLLAVLLEAGLARAARTGAHLVVSLVDLDDFKAVNDEHGHAAGDAVLQEAARRLTEGVRGADVVARLGGDEFVTVHETDATGGRAVLRRLAQVLSPPYRLPSGAEVVCAPSIGTADSAHHSEAADLLAAADSAMYAAKRRHRASASNGGGPAAGPPSH